MPSIRRALGYVKREYKWMQPLIEAGFKTDGVNLFVEEVGTLVNASHRSTPLFWSPRHCGNRDSDVRNRRSLLRRRLARTPREGFPTDRSSNLGKRFATNAVRLPEPYTFFVDRCLGTGDVCAVLRSAGRPS
jgi:hypothetical protein